MPVTNGFSFGVSCIDALIDPSKMGYQVDEIVSKERTKPIVACIAGPDGVGKSILSLTAASVFASTNPKESGRVVYASTDLNYTQARRAWDCFGLNLPTLRYEKLKEHVDIFQLDALQIGQIENTRPESDKCELVWLSPFSCLPSNAPEELRAYSELFPISAKSKLIEHSVYLLDLAAYSGGDDWSLINHTVGLLKNQFPHDSSRNLLIVDAVEGLEAMAGDRDRFGLVRTRRSRLAQLVRLARKANCHVVFVIEQGDNLKHLDEVFVSDLVIKLRSEQIDGYMQKTIEIEKARGVSHVRGIHEIQIRNGEGGGDGKSTVPDDPMISFPNESPSKTLSYLQVIPSLHVKRQTR